MFDDVTPIDLTLPIDERLPSTFPPHVPFVRRTWNWFRDEDHGPEAWTSNCGPYFTEVLMDEHIATHFDAPGHFVRDHVPGQVHPIGGDEVPLDAFCGRAVVLDVVATGTAPGWPAPNVAVAELLLSRACAAWGPTDRAWGPPTDRPLVGRTRPGRGVGPHRLMR